VVRLFFNIVHNAIKYTDNGSVNINVTNANETNSVRISVVDTGMGIKSEEKDLLFTAFSQINTSNSYCRPKSSGLGLAIAKEIVELHKGSISVESNYGVGSTFHIELPVNN
jgi:two-component system phosphate regulon sensor histidine kinase PhoR